MGTRMVSIGVVLLILKIKAEAIAKKMTSHGIREFKNRPIKRKHFMKKWYSSMRSRPPPILFQG